MNNKQDFLDFLCVNFMVDKNEIDLDTSLIDQGIIDSFGLVEIAAFIEQKTKKKVTQEDMVKENFGSFIKILNFMERLAS